MDGYILAFDQGTTSSRAILFDNTGKPKTAHTTNRVPCLICDNTDNRTKYQLSDVTNPGLSNLAATIAILCGVNDLPKEWDQPLIKLN